MSYAIRDDLKYMEGHVYIRMSTKHIKFYTKEIRTAKCVHSEVLEPVRHMYEVLGWLNV